MTSVSVAHAQGLPEAAQEPIKVHAEEAKRHVGKVPVLQRMGFARPKDVVLPTAFKKVVYGYLPYWSEQDTVPWEHLTHLSYFAVEMNSNGSTGLDHGWSSSGDDLVLLGAAYGVDVTLTAILFDNNAIATLLGNATSRQAAIDNLLELVQDAGGRGINIDFEFVPVSAKANFVTFMTDLTEAFHEAIPGSHVTLATPPVDWAGSYDYDALAEATDGLMIMAYGYHYAGGPPGPLSPVGEYVSQANYANPPQTAWGTRTLFWTAADYIKWGKWENRHKFIMGFPVYGHDWPTTSATVPGTRHPNTGQTSGPVTSTPRFDGCQTALAARGEQWDEDSQTPYAVYQDGGYWRQLFCENTRSLEAKFDLVNHEGVDFGGVMFWAIGYADPTAAVWTKVDQRFKYPPEENVAPVASAVAPDSVVAGTTVTLDGSDSADSNGDELTYSWTQLAGPNVTIEDAMLSLASVTLEDVGTYRFRLTVGDGTTTANDDVQIVVTEAGDDDGGPIDDEDGEPLPGDSDPDPQGGDPFTENPNVPRDPIERKGGCAATDASSLAPLLFGLVMLWRRRTSNTSSWTVRPR